MEQLRARRGGAIGGARRQRILVAHGLHHQYACGGDVLVHERGRDLQRRGDVVEAIARFIARQISAGSTSMPSRSCTALAYSLRLRRCRPTLPGSECAAPTWSSRPSIHEMKAARGGFVGYLVAAGRHLLAAQLAHGLLEHVDVVGDVLLGHGVERDATGPVLGVVALGAVAAEHIPAHRAAGMRGGSVGGQRRLAEAGREKGSAEGVGNAKIFHFEPTPTRLFRQMRGMARIGDTFRTNHWLYRCYVDLRRAQGFLFEPRIATGGAGAGRVGGGVGLWPVIPRPRRRCRHRRGHDPQRHTRPSRWCM